MKLQRKVKKKHKKKIISKKMKLHFVLLHLYCFYAVYQKTKTNSKRYAFLDIHFFYARY